MKNKLLLTLILISITACGSTQTITKVYDGDTVTYSGYVPPSTTERLRLLGINCPEISGRKGKQPFGIEARDFVREWIKENEYEVEFVIKKNGSLNRDNFGRPLVWILTRNNKVLNVILVSEGLALYKTYGQKNLKYDKQLREADKEAKTAKRGIWSK